MINDAAAKEKNNQEITLECRAEHGGPHYTGPDEKSGWSSTIGTYLWENAIASVNTRGLRISFNLLVVNYLLNGGKNL